MKIFYDVDTQNDFMNKDGALYVPDAELIKPNLKLLTDFAREKFVPVVGSVDKHFGTEEYKHREQELKRWSGPFPDHCMDKTFGQEKIIETIPLAQFKQGGPLESNAFYVPHSLDNHMNLITREYALTTITSKLQDLIRKKIGIYFEKQSYDIFTNPTFSEFLKQANIKQAVVYGVATDYCVKAAVLGMQNRDIQCYVVQDAIKGVFPESTQKALEEMAKVGAKLITTKDILEGKIK